MIIYENNAEGFLKEYDDGSLIRILLYKFETLFEKPRPREITSWNNSLPRMGNILKNANIPGNCGILIEYKINSAGNRIDFLISGHDEHGNKNVIIVELKQWSKVEETYVDDVLYVSASPEGSLKVSTYTGGAIREVVHPSYQAKSYKNYLEDMNETIHSGNVKAYSCSYLHNYLENSPEPLKAPQFNEILIDTPMFLSEDSRKLSEFIKKYVGNGDGLDILYEVENGRIRPSKNLVNHMNKVLEGNNTYVLIDEQKVAYSSIIKYSLQPKKKTAIIVNGGPGTGKSVVAVLALKELLSHNKNVRFITPNAAFRCAIINSITKSKINDQRINVLFSGSSKYYNSKMNEFDVLIVDETHRLKSPGTYMYAGEKGQVWDVMNSAMVSIFFVDDAQAIRKKDEGSVKKIKEVAKELDVECKEVTLETQFRCAGAERYVNWVENVLELKKSEIEHSWTFGYDFKIFDNPNEMYEAIMNLNSNGIKARVVAGYAWEWADKSSENEFDVVMKEHEFYHSWNYKSKSKKWAVDETMKEQIGCIHSCQGLEFDYVGVIIGNDLKYDSISKKLYSDYKEYKDKAGKSGLKNNPEELSKYIRNIYRVLLTRGIKGCYVFCRNEELKCYLRSCIK